MVVPPMQSIGGHNNGTYTLYMSPFTADMLQLQCRPCLGPRQLKFGDYLLLFVFLGVLWGWHIRILGTSTPSFNTRIVAPDLSGNRSGEIILCLQHLLKVSGTTLTIHSTKLLWYQLVLLPHIKSIIASPLGNQHPTYVGD